MKLGMETRLINFVETEIHGKEVLPKSRYQTAIKNISCQECITVPT